MTGGDRGKMVWLQEPVICHAFHSKQVEVHLLMVNWPFPWAMLLTSDILGYISDGNGSMAESFNENMKTYVNSNVVQGLKRDGRHLRWIHNSPQSGHLPDYAPHHVIVLKVEDGTGILLPIIVLDLLPSVLLMAALLIVRIVGHLFLFRIESGFLFSRLVGYIEFGGVTWFVLNTSANILEFQMRLMRQSRCSRNSLSFGRVITLSTSVVPDKVIDETESVTFDLRPSDAIDIAVRCNVPFICYSLV
ncbi:hypothetical protein V6N13_139064 [Hibiscus sabdariffa]